MKSKHRNAESLIGWILFDISIQFAAVMMAIFVVMSMLPQGPSDTNIIPGRICAEIYWPNDRDVDLDLWGIAPTEKIPVRYSRMHGAGLDLFRDVTGFANNPEHTNMEVMCGNKIYPGEWTFDINYFSNHKATTVDHSTDPIDATMILRIVYPDNFGRSPVVLKTTWHFTHEKEDKTMFNFRIDDTGTFVDSSFNTVNKFLAVR
jgi:hypothetical protein